MHWPIPLSSTKGSPPQHPHLRNIANALLALLVQLHLVSVVVEPRQAIKALKHETARLGVCGMCYLILSVIMRLFVFGFGVIKLGCPKVLWNGFQDHCLGNASKSETVEPKPWSPEPWLPRFHGSRLESAHGHETKTVWRHYTMSPQNSRQPLQNPHLTKSTFEMLNVGLLGRAKAEFSTHPPADGACLQPGPIPRCWDNPPQEAAEWCQTSSKSLW